MVSGQFLVLFKEGGFLKTENMKHVEVILSTVLEAGPRWRKSCKFSLEDPRAVVFFFTSFTLSPPQHTHTHPPTHTHHRILKPLSNLGWDYLVSFWFWERAFCFLRVACSGCLCGLRAPSSCPPSDSVSVLYSLVVSQEFLRQWGGWGKVGE